MGVKSVATKIKILSNDAPIKIANHSHPFSQGWKVGDLVFTGGIAPEDPETGRVVEPDIEIQARRVFESLKAILLAAGTSLKNVIKVNVFFVNISHKQGFERVYREYFPSDAPGRTSVEVKSIGPGILLELDAIAVVD